MKAAWAAVVLGIVACQTISDVEDYEIVPYAETTTVSGTGGEDPAPRCEQSSCDVMFNAGCSAGESCYVIIVGGGAYRTGCCEDVGTQHHGEPCNAAANDCVSEAECLLPEGGGAVGTCYDWCSEESFDCPAGSVCRLAEDSIFVSGVRYSWCVPGVDIGG